MHALIHILADGLVVPVALGAAYAFWYKIPASQRARAYSLLVMVGVTTYLFAKLLAAVWQPDAARPFVEKGVAAGAFYLQNAGFPSDHALFCTFLTLGVWFLTRQKRLTVALAIMTVLVCIGRVLALVHTPLDVIGGVVIASFAAVWYGQYHTSYAIKHSSRVPGKNVVQ